MDTIYKTKQQQFQGSLSDQFRSTTTQHNNFCMGAVIDMSQNLCQLFIYSVYYMDDQIFSHNVLNP